MQVPDLFILIEAAGLLAVSLAVGAHVKNAFFEPVKFRSCSGQHGARAEAAECPDEAGSGSKFDYLTARAEDTGEMNDLRAMMLILNLPKTST